MASRNVECPTIVKSLTLKECRGQWMTFKITIEVKNATIGPKIESFLGKCLDYKSWSFKVNLMQIESKKKIQTSTNPFSKSHSIWKA